MSAKLSTQTAQTEHRLDRIEQKIDKLSEAIISIARAEEKLVSLENDKKFLMDKMISVEERVSSVEKKTDDNASTISIIHKVSWIIVTTTVATAIGAYIQLTSR